MRENVGVVAAGFFQGVGQDEQAALMLVAARLRHIAGTKWGTRRYLEMGRLEEPGEASPETPAAPA
jgi:hypothetical protein